VREMTRIGPPEPDALDEVEHSYTPNGSLASIHQRIMLPARPEVPQNAGIARNTSYSCPV
jgi:hypothetical protein